MSAETPALTRTFPVGRRWRCTITVQRPTVGQVANMVAEWEPGRPTRRLNKAELRQNREGRNALAAELSEILGERVAVIEI